MITIQSGSPFKEEVLNSVTPEDLELCYGELSKEFYLKGFKVSAREVTYPEEGIVIMVTHPSLPLKSYPHYFTK